MDDEFCSDIEVDVIYFENTSLVTNVMLLEIISNVTIFMALGQFAVGQFAVGTVRRKK